MGVSLENAFNYVRFLFKNSYLGSEVLSLVTREK